MFYDGYYKNPFFGLLGIICICFVAIFVSQWWVDLYYVGVGLLYLLLKCFCERAQNLKVIPFFLGMTMVGCLFIIIDIVT